MPNTSPPIRFVDVFAGCGGLSLGLSQAGCKGVFAIEKSALAFETLRHNLVDGKHFTFDWPAWLPKKAMTCEELIELYAHKLDKLKGTIDLMVGGPPCQGFSTAGRRDPTDPRNQMAEQYLTLVAKLEPRFLIIENVAGFNMRFESEADATLVRKNSSSKSYATYVASRLEELGYDVSRGLINCADFGVPQNRLRYLILCERRNSIPTGAGQLLDALIDYRALFLQQKGLPPKRRITTKEAIHDLRTVGRLLTESTDSDAGGFKEAAYVSPSTTSGFLKLMREHCDGAAPNSRRLANHREPTVEYFKTVQKIARPGHCMSIMERKKVGTKKHSTTVLHSDRPAPTITTLPDDIIHYNEPRILTVRENARLQSFPDWFEFKGKYTTGGKQRKLECPRYTQVGNAVPPLLANALGVVITNRMQQSREAQNSKASRNPTRTAAQPQTLSSNNKEYSRRPKESVSA